MRSARVSRRDLLEKSIALGVVTVAAGLTPAAIAAAWDEAAARPRTPENALGPFYKKHAPDTRTMRIAGDPGMPLAVSGGVFSTRGEALPEATVEVWHTDHRGRYDIDGYRYRARFKAADAKYAFDSIMPGHYPDRVCQHVHYLVTAPGHRPLVTQLYFATDPVFEGDPGKNFTRDPLIMTPELVRPVILAGDPGDVRAVVTLDLVLERL